MDMPPPSVPPLPNNPPPPPNFMPPSYPQTPPAPKQKFPVWAIVLMAVGGCGVLGIIILAAILFPVFAQARNKAVEVRCLSNMKQMSAGLLMYQQDYDERMPPATQWMDGTFPYIRNEKVFHCSLFARNNPENYGYAFNSNVSELSRDQIMRTGINERTTPMLFESSKLGRNEYDALTSVMNPPRHHDSNNFAYLDGHAKSIRGEYALNGKGEMDNGGFGQFSAPGNGGQ